MKKVLHDALTLRGRFSRVVLVCEIDETNKRSEIKSKPTIPGSVSKYSLSRFKCLQTQEVVGKSVVALTWNMCLHFIPRFDRET